MFYFAIPSESPECNNSKFLYVSYFFSFLELGNGGKISKKSVRQLFRMKKNYSAKICMRCLKSFIPTASPQKYCGSHLTREGCSFIVMLKNQRERARRKRSRLGSLGGICGACGHLLLLHRRAPYCQFGLGKKCLCVKQRYNQGIRSANAKQDESDVLQIRSLARKKNAVEISRQFRVHPNTVSAIINRKAWTHLN
jgi:hypothetical protein